MSDLTPQGYIHVLSELKRKIKQAKYKAALTVNFELLKVYWEIGSTVLEQQKIEGWGAKIVDRLSKDLKSEFTDIQGLSVRNIKYMRSFVEAYPNFSIVQPLAAQIQDIHNQIAQDLVEMFYQTKHVLTVTSYYVKQKARTDRALILKGAKNIMRETTSDQNIPAPFYYFQNYFNIIIYKYKL